MLKRKINDIKPTARKRLSKVSYNQDKINQKYSLESCTYKV